MHQFADPIAGCDDLAEHRSLDGLESGLRALAAAPKDCGRLMMIVRRPGSAERQVLESAELTPEDGLPGDSWGQGASPKIEAQITVIRHDVATLIANGQPLVVSGDNLVVDLDISDENLPAGSRLRIGQALLEVTPLPHNGCKKFQRRFGADALRFVQAPATRRMNLRGSHWKVIEPGEIRAGDRIEVLSRAERSTSR